LIGLACRHLDLEREMLLGNAYVAGVRVDPRSIGRTPRISILDKIHLSALCPLASAPGLQ